MITDKKVHYSEGKPIYPLQPGGNYMYRHFNNQQFYVVPTQCIYVFCVDLRTNSHYFPIQHKLTGLYNRDGVCLPRGTDWSCKCNSGWFSSLNVPFQFRKSRPITVHSSSNC
jgi:hypothetical protein